MSINVAIRIRHAIYNIRSLLAPHRYIVVHHGVPIRRLITVSSRSFPTSDVAHLEHVWNVSIPQISRHLQIFR